MKCRFIHAADIHLGYEQYNLVQRANDFARAYIAMIDHAVNARVDFVILAGDLFHRASADAWMLKQATHGLERLRDAGIPVVAVEGNHDVQHARKNLSWLEFLCDQELLTLLNVRTAPNGYKDLPAFDTHERRGAYVDIAGARIYGLKYVGAATGRILDEVRDLVEEGPNGYTILILHNGMDGQVPHMHGGLTTGQVAPFHPPVDYLALGHVHKRLMEEWIFNPGSLETNSFDEMDWPHGFFDVQVDTSLPGKHRVTEVATPDLRPFHRISVTVDDNATLDDYVAQAREKIDAARGMREAAVIELHLGGVAFFRRQDVPVDALAADVQVRFNPLAVRVRNNIVPPGLVTLRHHERSSRAEIERQVVEHLVYQNTEYRDRAAHWARLILDIKNMAADKDTPASIADHVRAAMGGMATPEDQEEQPGAPPTQDEQPDLSPMDGERELVSLENEES
ncbi:MAG: DNA repair exonuclease [Chloroflexota bacterium]